MKPLKLVLNAFGPFAKKQEVDFSPVLNGEIFLITGETGAGKTTIFDGISFALYGNASGDSRKPSTFKSDHAPAGEPCYVEFWFSLHGKTFYVRRSPAQKGVKRDGSAKDISPSAELTLPGGDVITGFTAVTEHIEGLLCLNHRQFKQTTMLAQGEFRRLIEANGQEKQQIFSKIFGTSQYSRLADFLAQEENLLNERLQRIFEKIAHCVHDLRSYGHSGLDGDDAAYLGFSRIKEIVLDNIAKTALESSELDDNIALLEAEGAKLDPLQSKKHNERLDRRDELRKIRDELAVKQPEFEASQLKINRIRSAVELAAQEEIILKTKKQSENSDAIIAELKQKLETQSIKEKKLAGFTANPPEVVLELSKKLADEKARYDAMYRDFLNSQAGIFSGSLKDGEPCPVCGSVHHPAPAPPACENVTEQALDNVKHIIEKLEKCLADEREKIKQAHWQAKSDLERLQSGLDSEISHREQNFNQFKSLRGEFKQRLRDAGFESYNDYSQVLKDKHTLSQLTAFAEKFSADLVATGAQLDELERETKGHVRCDVEAITQKSNRIKQDLAALRERKVILRAMLQNSKNRLDELEDLNRQNDELQERHKIAQELAGIAKGRRSISFERYVLATYFADIIHLANIHLQRMTGSRYRLNRREDPEKGSGSGLDMEIIDSYTGKRREVGTLSGGESFKASLALALGLSGVVQIYSGGVSIDTMFIDEGFGSLDEKSLDLAVETLVTLKESGRMVGVISHVPALKGYIPKKLQVSYNPCGSSISWV